MAAQLGSSSDRCDSQPRAVDPRTCNDHAPERDRVTAQNDVANQIPRAERAPRTAESERAAVAYQDLNALPPSKRPIAVERTRFAQTFDALMHEHWLRGDTSYSNVAVARACGVDEKTVRQWREGEKPMPAAALALLPGQIYSALLDAFSATRGRTPKRSIVLLREGLAGLRRDLAHEDPLEVRRAIRDAQRDLLELADLLEDGR